MYLMSYITCPICGRRIVTSGSTAPSICPACGASLLATEPAPIPEPITAQYREDDTGGGAEDDSATRPVPIDQLPTRPSAAPASPTPPSAAATPALDLAREGDDGSTRDLPPSALPKPTETPQTPVARAVGAGRVIGAAALVVVLLAVVAGVALAINGALPFGQPAATPTATPAPPATLAPTATPATHLYTPAGLYQISYPTGWNKTEQNSPPTTYQASFINPRGGATVSVTAQQTGELLDPATNDTNYLNGLASTTGTKATNISAPEAITLAGQTWTQESGDVALATPAGQQYAHAAVISINHGGYLYTIVRLVPVTDPSEAASAFTAADQASFQPILASFAFLN